MEQLASRLAESKLDQGSRSLSINLHCRRACGLEGYEDWVRVDKGMQQRSDALTYHMSIHFSRVPCELGADMHLFSPVEINYCIIWYLYCMCICRHITLSFGPQFHWTAGGTSSHVCKWLRFACFVNTTATVNSSLSEEGSTLLPRFINGTAFLAHCQLLPVYKCDGNRIWTMHTVRGGCSRMLHVISRLSCTMVVTSIALIPVTCFVINICIIYLVL